jgi:hypothetical protein
MLDWKGYVMRGQLSQSVIAMLQFGLIFEVRGVGDGASWPIKGHN